MKANYLEWKFWENANVVVLIWMLILRDVHVNQLKQHSIIDNGMAIGLAGNDHVWTNINRWTWSEWIHLNLMWFLSAFTVCKWMLNAAFHTCDSLSKKTSYFKSIGWFFVPFLLLLMMMKRARFFNMFIIFTKRAHLHTHQPNIRANTRIQNTLALLYAQQWSDFDKLKARFFFLL